MVEAQIAFIGGSGLYNVEGLTDRREISVETPFGTPSDNIVLGTLGGAKVAFLPRHGRGHRFAPTEIPSQANIYALKLLGIEQLISISAVGSLKEEVKPQDILVPDQLLDRTRNRTSTFFGGGIVAHVGFADPFCPVLSRAIIETAERQNVIVHSGGTYVVMEGPQFSTKAESELFRSWGASIIGMTALPEAKLAREAEICYATMGLVTDYDCWHDQEEEVSVDLLVRNLHKCVEASQSIIRELASSRPSRSDCACSDALKDAIITSPEQIPEGVASRLSAIVGKYLKVSEEVKQHPSKR